MKLFPKSVLDDVRRIPGARHAFLRHVTADDGATWRSFAEEEASAAPEGVQNRWRDLLVSLDNRRFTQGHAEVAVSAMLRRSGWSAVGVRAPGPMLVFADPNGQEVDVAVLSFARQQRPKADQAVIDRLLRGLDRLDSKSRVAVVVRRWLPHDFDPEPVRRAIDMWLQEVDRGGWEGRYAAYDDEAVSLEFALTGGRTTTSSGVVAFSLGPMDALRTLEAVQKSLVAELDRWRHAVRPDPARPLLAMCVCTQPWGLPRGYVREMLLGKPIRMTTGPDGFLVHFGIEQSPSLLRDPLQRGVQGIFFVDASVEAPEQVQARGYLNPWAQRPRDPAHFAFPNLATSRQAEDGPVLRWFAPR